MDGDTAVAKILKAEGVEWVAAYPHQDLIEAAAKEGIRPIIPRQERAGVNMADGFSRVKNGKKIGVFIMQRGPGAENAFGGVAQAFSDSVPILLFPGGHPRSRIGVHPGFDSFEHYQGITKWTGHVNLVERIPEMMTRAFTALKHGRRGPVMLEIPTDVAAEEYPGNINYEPVREFKSAADPDDVREMVTALMNAKNPVINAGQGVMYAEATDDLVEFAELTNIPVMTTLTGKSGYPENHRLALGTGGHSATLMVDQFLKKADFVLGMGTAFAISTFNAPMPPGVTLAQVTNSVDDVNKDYRIQHGAIGDAKIVLRQMIEEVKRQIGGEGRGDTEGVAAEIAKLKKSFMDEWNPRFYSDEVPISPYRVFHEIAKSLGSSNTIITHDSGYPRDQLVPFWQATKPRGYLGWGKSTQLGYGLGLALGAKLAAPDKNVVNVMGDAAFGMAGMDLETAARSNIGTTTVILNNSVMTHYSSHMPYATERYGANRFSGEYVKVGEGLGAHSEQVKTPDQLGPALKRATEANAKGQPALLEVITKEEKAVASFW